MRASSLVVLATTWLAACAGEEPPPLASTSSPIINGTDDPGHPAVAFLSNDVVAGCSGTLISSKIVLTAAHCVVDGPRIRTLDSVIFGATGSSGKRYVGEKTIWHTGFTDGFPWPNDIALIVLKGRADIEPLGLNTAVPQVGQMVTFVGFGLQSSPNGLFGIKQSVTVPVTEVLEQWIYYGPGTCQGDSGGPGLVTVGGKEVVAGIVSFGELGCQGLNASQRVDVHIPWIQEQIARYDPPSCERDFHCIAGAGCPTGDADCPCTSGDGTCSALCDDPESDSDCPRGCGPGDSCVRGPTCPAPDPDCGDPCGGEGHCLEACPSRDPDCPAPKAAGAACERNFECTTSAICYQNVCTDVCAPVNSACGNGGTCTQLTPQVSLCRGEKADDGGGGGCRVVPGDGGSGAVAWILCLAFGALLSRARTRRPRSRPASSRR